MKADARIASTRGSASLNGNLPEMVPEAYPLRTEFGERPGALGTPADEPVMSALAGALTRLEEVIGAETTALEARHAVDLQDFNRRKSRSLLELTRIIRALPPKVMDDGVRLRIDRLRVGLVRNKELLRVHLAAAQEIAEVLANALGD